MIGESSAEAIDRAAQVAIDAIRAEQARAEAKRPEWPKERPDGSWVWANGSLCMPPPGECAYCDSMRETPGPGGFFPSHNGSPYCYGHPYSIAKAGPNGRAHCTCDACF